MIYEFTKLAEVEALTEVPENATVFAEVDGTVKRIPGSGLGGNNNNNNNKEFLFRKKFENYDDGSGKVSDGKSPEATTYDFDLEEMRTIFDKGEFPNITLEISWDYEGRTFFRKLINPLAYVRAEATGLVINIFFVNIDHATGMLQTINLGINTNTGIVSTQANG